MYGFHKIRTPKTEILYTHMLFCRGKKHQVKEICRKVEKKMVKGGNTGNPNGTNPNTATSNLPNTTTHKPSQQSISVNLEPSPSSSPYKKNQQKSRALVGNLININWSLL